MGAGTKIEWCHYSFNPWWGCTHAKRDADGLSGATAPECQRCYAQAFSHRLGFNLWGPDSARRPATEHYWLQPLKWDDAAAFAGERRRVFCASMADVGEDRRDLDPYRHRLWELIEQTPHLDWLLLTKRPANLARMVPWRQRWPRNVWAGTTCGHPDSKWRVEELLRIDAWIRVRFVSVEPLLADLGDIMDWLWPLCRATEEQHNRDHGGGEWCAETSIDWVIAGAESGRGARLAHPDWFRSLRDQCSEASVPYFFKQWGEWRPHGSVALWRDGGREIGQEGVCMMADGRVISRDLSVAEHRKRGLGRVPGYSTRTVDTDVYPEWAAAEGEAHNRGSWTWPYSTHQWMYRVGKKAAGAMLDGREHREFPQ